MSVCLYMEINHIFVLLFDVNNESSVQKIIIKLLSGHHAQKS